MKYDGYKSNVKKDEESEEKLTFVLYNIMYDEKNKFCSVQDKNGTLSIRH